MLLHLPIVILATLSSIAVSDTVPKFDIARECHFEGGTADVFDKCTQDEAAALQRLRTERSRFAGRDAKDCTVEATIGGFESYVELLTCLDIASYRTDEDDSSEEASGKTKLQTGEPAQPWTGIGDG